MLMRGLEMKSWVQTSPSHKEKGLVTIEHFFGSIKSAISNRAMNKHCTLSNEDCYFIEMLL